MNETRRIFVGAIAPRPKICASCWNGAHERCWESDGGYFDCNCSERGHSRLLRPSQREYR